MKTDFFFRQQMELNFLAAGGKKIAQGQNIFFISEDAKNLFFFWEIQ